jgi:cytochrome c oxidase assembly protein subunit 15
MTSQSATGRKSKVYWLSLATWILLFFVNTMGFVDTQTNSSLGMGRSWPFSEGGILPQHWQQSALIEFTHRAIVFVFMVMLFTLAVLAWRRYGKWIEVKVLLSVAIVFVFLEAALGAMAVLFVNPPAVTASHMGIALVSFAGVLLLTGIIKQIDANGGPEQLTPLRTTLPDRSFAKWAWFALGYVFVSIYFGAYVASSGAGGRFQGWPLPAETYAHAHSAFVIDVVHRSLALGLVLLLVWLTVRAYRMRADRPELFKAARAALVLSGFQALSGALLIYTQLSLVAFLIHVSIVTFIFSLVAYLCLQTLPEPNRLAARKQAAVKPAQKPARA